MIDELLEIPCYPQSILLHSKFFNILNIRGVIIKLGINEYR